MTQIYENNLNTAFVAICHKICYNKTKYKEVSSMSTVSVRIDSDLYSQACLVGKVEQRSASQQLNYWAKLGKNAAANPDLPTEFINDNCLYFAFNF